MVKLEAVLSPPCWLPVPESSLRQRPGISRALRQREPSQLRNRYLLVNMLSFKQKLHISENQPAHRLETACSTILLVIYLVWVVLHVHPHLLPTLENKFILRE